MTVLLYEYVLYVPVVRRRELTDKFDPSRFWGNEPNERVGGRRRGDARSLRIPVEMAMGDAGSRHYVHLLIFQKQLTSNHFGL
jgi:hypothetical protein